LLALAATALSGLAFAAGASDYVVPQPARHTLDNGLEILVIEAHGLPNIHYRLLIKSGAAQEEAAKAGLAAMTAQVLLNPGEGSTTARAYGGRLGDLGNQITASAAHDYSLLTAQGPSRHWREVLRLFAGRVLKRTVSGEDVAFVRDRMVNELVQSRSDVGGVADEHFLAVAYGGHPYARPPGGDQQSVAALTQEDVESYAASHWRPNNAVLILAGDVNPPEVFEVAAQAFGSWERGEVPTIETEPAPVLDQNRPRAVNRVDLEGFEVRVGFTSVPLTPEDELAMQALNFILGGGRLGSRLARDLHSRIGAEQTVSTVWSSGKLGGFFLLSTYTRNEELRTVLDACLAVIRELQESGPTSEEVETAKRYLKGAQLYGFQTPGAIADRWLNVEMYGRGDDYLASYPERVDALKAVDISRVAGQVLRTEPLVYVTVGNRVNIKGQLAPYGMAQHVSFHGRTGAIPEIEVPLPGPTVEATPEAREKAAALVAAATKTHGGAEALAGVSSWRVTGQIEMNIGPGDALGDFVEVALLPDHRRVDMQVEGQRVVRTVGGEKGWISAGEQITDMAPGEVQAMQITSFSNLVLLLDTLQDPGLDLRYAGDQERFERSVAVVEWVIPDAGLARLYFTAGGDTLLAMEQMERAPVGSGAVTVLRLFEDPRNVGGILYPHRTSVYMNGARAMRETVSQVEFGVELSDEIFRRPLQ
jgi:predicted Zn-dependent peptidase